MSTPVEKDALVTLWFESKLLLDELAHRRILHCSRAVQLRDMEPCIRWGGGLSLIGSVFCGLMGGPLSARIGLPLAVAAAGLLSYDGIGTHDNYIAQHHNAVRGYDRITEGHTDMLEPDAIRSGYKAMRSRLASLGHATTEHVMWSPHLPSSLLDTPIEAIHGNKPTLEIKPESESAFNRRWMSAYRTQTRVNARNAVETALKV